MSFNADQPYNDLPLLPPNVELETTPVLKQCIKATRALAEVKGAAKLIPDPSVLINSIPLREAQASSEIENIVTTTDELFRAAAAEHESDNPAIKEVLRYRTALRAGFEALEGRPISVNLLRDTCSTLMNRQIDVRKVPGTRVANQQTGQVIYSPPEGEEIIRQKLNNLETYVHAEDGLDPLIRLAVIHYQFEAIHPFHDGNGRTGRILNLLYLIEKDLLDAPVLYLSRYIIDNKPDYYRLLQTVTEHGTWEPWLLFILNAVESTASWTTGRIHAIRDLMEETTERCRVDLPGKVFSLELMHLIFRQPYCRINFLVEAGLAKRETAARYLDSLEELGILKHEKVGRDKVYLNQPFLQLLMER